MRETNLSEMIKNYEQTLNCLGIRTQKNWNKRLLFARRMKGNATKISYISKSKIEGLKTNVKGFILNPECLEQRQKHFTAERPNKFLNRLIDSEYKYTSTEHSLIEKIAETFNKQFLANIKNEFKFFKGQDIAEAYNENKSIIGCMSGKSLSYFNVYANTEGLRLATLIDESGTILIRALLWYCKTSKKYFLDNSYEQSNINGDEQLRRTYQGKLLKAVLKAIRRKAIDCAFNSTLSKDDKQICFRDDESKGVTTYPNSKMLPICNNIESEFYPYSDNFKSICKFNGEWATEENSGDADYILLNDTNGTDCNADRIECLACGNVYADEDDGIFYSEYHQEQICEDCSVYCEDREDYINSNDTSYDNYRSVYVCSDDIE